MSNQEKEIIFEVKKVNEALLPKKKEGTTFLGIDTFLLNLMVNNLLISACWTNMAPFFPSEAAQKGVSTTVIGVIFSAQPIGGVLASIILLKYLVYFGRMSTLRIGLFLNIITAGILGAIYYISDTNIFIISAVFCRILQGIGRACYFTSSISILTLIYPETLQKKIAAVEAMSGLGILVGPLMGSGIYSLFGYSITFFTFTGILLIFLPWSWKGMEKENKRHDCEKKRKKINIWKAIRVYRIWMIFFCFFIVNNNLDYLGPLLSTHLERFGIPNQYDGLIFPVGSIVYVIMLKIVSTYSKNESAQNRFFISAGIFSHVFSQLMLGPVPYVLPHHVSVVILSQIFLGISFALILLPFVSEVVFLLQPHFPKKEEDVQSLNDFASGLLNTAITAGGILGPTLGATLEENIGFVNMTYIFAGVTFLAFVIYFAFGYGLQGTIDYLFTRHERSIKNGETRVEEGEEESENIQRSAL